MFHRLAVLTWAASIVLASGCLCSEGNKLDESKTITGSQTVLWETIKLGQTSETFVKQLAKLASVPPSQMDDMIKCKDQFAVNIIDPVNATIAERLAGKHALTSCTLLQAGAYKSWTLLSVQALLLDNKLSSLTFRFKQSEFEIMRTKLEARFGKGDLRKLNEISLLGETKVDAILWRVDDSIWALQKTDVDISVTHQIADTLLDLPLPKGPAKPGEKINVDDLGFKADVNLDDIVAPDLEDGTPSKDAGTN